MSCPGSDDSVCSRRGVCKTARELAALTPTTTLFGTMGFVYGVDPNAVATWDADMVQGCYCDKVHSHRSTSVRYTGYDCAKSEAFYSVKIPDGCLPCCLWLTTLCLYVFHCSPVSQRRRSLDSEPGGRGADSQLHSHRRQLHARVSGRDDAADPSFRECEPSGNCAGEPTHVRTFKAIDGLMMDAHRGSQEILAMLLQDHQRRRGVLGWGHHCVCCRWHWYVHTS